MAETPARAPITPAEQILAAARGEPTQPTQAPPRRSGRGSGYEHRDQLLAANRRLGAALAKLARDPQPEPRRVGAQLAADIAALVDTAAAAAGDSTTPARNVAADVARRLPTLERDLAAARERMRQRPPDQTPGLPSTSKETAP